MAPAHVGHLVAPPFGDGAAVPDSPTRRRLLALLAGLRMAGTGVGVGYARPGAVPGGDPLPHRFAAFRALLDSHAAALAECNRLEGALSVDVRYPRVRLPRGADGAVLRRRPERGHARRAAGPPPRPPPAGAARAAATLGR